MNGSILSYPQRGVGGDARYRGNCSPLVVRDCVLQFNPTRGLVIDPCQGSGTTGDVCRELGIAYRGFDLKDGFDSRRTRIRDHIERPASFAWVHPPYAGMIRYSRDIWNNGQDHPADLSRHGTDIDAFLDDLQDMLFNVFDALAIGATYAVLLGLWRHPETKDLIHLPARMLPRAPGALVNEIIKAQHNTTSGMRAYSRTPFAFTTHEVVLVFKKTESGLRGTIINAIAEAEATERATFRALARAFVRNRTRITTDTLVDALAKHPRAKRVKDLRAKARQTLGFLVASGDLLRVGAGQYLLAA